MSGVFGGHYQDLDVSSEVRVLKNRFEELAEAVPAIEDKSLEGELVVKLSERVTERTERTRRGEVGETEDLAEELGRELGEIVDSLRCFEGQRRVRGCRGRLCSPPC